MSSARLHQIKNILGSLVSRIFLGLTAIATTVANLPLADKLSFDLSKALVVSGAISLWVAAEWASFESEPHPHDVKLRNTIANTLYASRPFLDQHDFGAAFNGKQMHPFYEVYDSWKGIEYAFQDKTLQRQWAKTLASIKDFTEIIVKNTGPVGSANTHFTFKTFQDQRGGVSQQTLKLMSKANGLASIVYCELEELEAMCLRKLAKPAVTQTYNSDEKMG